MARLYRVSQQSKPIADAFRKKGLYPGKVYAEQKLREDGGLNPETARGTYEEVGTLPERDMPTTLSEVIPFCNEWIRGLLQPFANDLGKPDEIFAPLVERLWNAVVAIPDAPAPPDKELVELEDMDPMTVIVVLKIFRDWARRSLAG